MYVEVLVFGVLSSVMSVEEVVNMVRERVGMFVLIFVDFDVVLDEKYVEFVMEWGYWFYDFVWYDCIEEFDYEINGEQVIYQWNEWYLLYLLLQLDLLL